MIVAPLPFRTVMSVSVCLNVSVRDHIFGTTRPISANFLHVACGRGSVLLPLAA